MQTIFQIIKKHIVPSSSTETNIGVKVEKVKAIYR